MNHLAQLLLWHWKSRLAQTYAVKLASLATLIAASLTGCSYFQGKQLNCEIRAPANLNPDINLRPSPLALTLVELRHNHPFACTYESAASPENLATSNTLNQHPMIIRPNEHKFISIPLTTHSEYLGIRAYFRDLDSSQWCKLLKLADRRRNNLVITLGPQSLRYSLNND